MFGQPTDAAPLDWSWVEEQLVRSDTYWVTTRGNGRPHPRPVWGVWVDDRLHLSIGSPEINRDLERDPELTVHLPNGIDVVIVEGTASGSTDDPVFVDAYDAKYDWAYDAEAYGPFVTVQPTIVMAWRAAGPAGRDGFRHVGCWRC